MEKYDRRSIEGILGGSAIAASRWCGKWTKLHGKWVYQVPSASFEDRQEPLSEGDVRREEEVAHHQVNSCIPPVRPSGLLVSRGSTHTLNTAKNKKRKRNTTDAAGIRCDATYCTGDHVCNAMRTRMHACILTVEGQCFAKRISQAEDFSLS